MWLWITLGEQGAALCLRSERFEQLCLYGNLCRVLLQLRPVNQKGVLDPLAQGGDFGQLQVEAVLGQHALAYTILSFLAVTAHRRVLWFSLRAQALHVLPIFVAGHAASLFARLIAGGMFPGWWLLAAPLLEAALWPGVVKLLLAPQRRAPNPDQNRPL